MAILKVSIISVITVIVSIIGKCTKNDRCPQEFKIELYTPFNKEASL